MTDAERRTLQKVYADARWDSHLLHYCYGRGPAQVNDEKWQKVNDFVTSHGITDDEYDDAIAAVE